MALTLERYGLFKKRFNKRTRRSAVVNFYTSGGSLGVYFPGITSIRFSKANGYRITLGFGAGNWYFKLWNSSGVQVGPTLARPSLSVLSAVVNANSVINRYTTMNLISGVTSIVGTSSLSFADAVEFSGGI